MPWPKCHTGWQAASTGPTLANPYPIGDGAGRAVYGLLRHLSLHGLAAPHGVEGSSHCCEGLDGRAGF